MNVIGYDPEITVEAAWSLPASVKKAQSLGEVLKHSNFVTVHVPLIDATRAMIDAGGSVPDEAPGRSCSTSPAVAWSTTRPCWRRCRRAALPYVCDFPGARARRHGPG